MDRLFRLRRDELRYNALAGREKYLGPSVKCVLFLVAFMVAILTRPGLLRQFFFYIYVGLFVCGMLVYVYLHRRLLRKYRFAIMVLSSCLEVFCISFIYCVLAGEHLRPIAFLLLSIPVLRV